MLHYFGGESMCGIPMPTLETFRNPPPSRPKQTDPIP